MISRKFSLAATAALLCAAAFTPVMLSAPAAAQSNPTLTNVVPDGGNFSARGKIAALDPAALTLTLAPENKPPVPLTVAPGVDLSDVSVGDVASVHYTRSVTFVVGSPNTAVAGVPATATVDPVRP